MSSDKTQVELPMWAAPGVFATLTLAMFFDLLFTDGQIVSSLNTDLATQFVAWREYGYSQLRLGTFPLWNPHIYSGTPYFAGFQSALLYPINWLHLFLPATLAINWITAMHVFLAGYFTYLWCRRQGINAAGSIVAGIIFMFSGPFFMRVYAGHLPHLGVMIWTPLMLLALDALSQTGDWRWIIPGSGATTMHILAGHPQYVYYTGIALTIYVAILTIRSTHRRCIVAGMLAMYLIASLISAVQLFSSVQAAGEFVRSDGASFQFASTLALSPASVITAIAPNFFGSVPMAPSGHYGHAYWGGSYLWEMTVFAGIGGLTLAVIGAVRGPRQVAAPAMVMIVITLVLALGRHTPLYGPMFELLPGYGSFRATAKFVYLTVLFVALLAALGLDSVWRNPPLARRFSIGVAAAAVLIALVAAIIRQSFDHWTGFVHAVVVAAVNSHEYFFPLDPSEPAFLDRAWNQAIGSLGLAAGMCALFAALLWMAPNRKWMPHLLMVTVAAEMFAFGRAIRATTEPRPRPIPAIWRSAIGAMPPDTRLLAPEPQFANAGMLDGFENLAGYDPGVLRRYAELNFASQQLPYSQATQYVRFDQRSEPLLRMFRCRLIMADPAQPPVEVPNPLAVAQLVSHWVTAENVDQAIAHVTQSDFDPATTVVLESPVDLPGGESSDSPGTVRLRDRRIGRVEIEADVSRPAVLLVTENYSTGWRVIPVAKAQSRYQILPANHALMAIPLQTGRHHLVLEYSPAAFRIGQWVSITSLISFFLGSIWLVRKAK